MEKTLLQILAVRGIPGVLCVDAADIPSVPENFLADVINAARATNRIQLLVNHVIDHVLDHDGYDVRKPENLRCTLETLLQAFSHANETFAVDEPVKLPGHSGYYRFNVRRSEKT